MEIPGLELNPLLSLPHLILLMLVLCALCAALAWRSAVRMPVGRRCVAVACRVLAVALLAVPLLNPGRWESEQILEEATTVILVDTSASMLVEDAPGGRRADAALASARLIETAAADAGRTVRHMVFDANVRRANAESLGEARFDGEGTDIAQALERVADIFGSAAGRVLEVVLISDGRQATPGDVMDGAQRLVGLGSKLHTITLGGEILPLDTRVAAARPQVTAFEGRSATVRANVSFQGNDRVRTQVALTGDALEGNYDEVLDLEPGESRAVRFTLPPLPAGLHEMEFVLDAVDGEEDVSNNRASMVVLVHDEPIRVLLIEGSPYWDTKFIAQLLQQDPNYRFELVYRLSDDRFFGLDDSEPLTADSGLPDAVRTVFPGTAEELSEVDLIIFGRATDEFLNDSHVTNLREWVAAGGALIFARGNPVSADWPGLDALMPMDWDVDWQGEFRWMPTYLGEDAGLFGDELPGGGDAVWGRLPVFQRAVFGTRLRPFTRVLVEGVATGAAQERKFPLVVSRRFGAGLVTTVNVNDFWRWDFIPESDDARKLYRTFWSRLFEWSLAYSEFLPGRNFALRPGMSEVDPGRPVRVRVMRRAGTEADIDPVLLVRDGTGDAEQLALSPVQGEPDLWETLVSFQDHGDKRIEAVPADDLSRSLAMATLTVRKPPSEHDDHNADPALMLVLSEATGGFTGGPGDGADWFNEAPLQTGREGDMRWKEAWTNPWLALGIVAAFSTEWFLRRRYNLA